eukprot:scaffold171459_cov26-Tisochrysis_lutea.AAC.1
MEVLGERFDEKLGRDLDLEYSNPTLDGVSLGSQGEAPRRCTTCNLHLEVPPFLGPTLLYFGRKFNSKFILLTA